MWVQTTIYDDRLPDTALGIGTEPVWHGLGIDDGYTVFRSDAALGGKWVMRRGWGGAAVNLTAHIPALDIRESDTLQPVAHFPEMEWIGSKWRCHVTDSDNEYYVRNTVPWWTPREWVWYAMADAEQGDYGPSGSEELPSAISARYFGDEWFTNQAEQHGDQPVIVVSAHGEFRNYGGVYTTSAVPPEQWELEDGTGTGNGAGIYRNTAAAQDKRYVGTLNRNTGLYEIGTSAAPTEMFSLGLLRMDLSAGWDIAAPSGWGFDGADWASPDPWDCRYWIAVRNAMLERESVLPDHKMGTLTPTETYLFDFGPYNPPTLRGMRAYRDMLKALADNYVDIDKVETTLSARQMPTRERIHLDFPEDLNGGWTHADAVSGGGSPNLGTWLANARVLLDDMVYTIAPRGILHRRSDTGSIVYGDSDNTSFVGVYAQAFNELRDIEPSARRWRYYTDTRWSHEAGTDPLNGFVNLQGGKAVENLTHAWYGDVYDWSVSLQEDWEDALDLNVPSASVLDGKEMERPYVLFVTESHKEWDSPEYEVGNHIADGIVVSNEYYSTTFTSGVHTGWGEIPVGFHDTAPGTCPHPPHVVTVEGQEEPGVSLWGANTGVFLYLWWGRSFRFSDVEPEPDEGGGEGSGESGGDGAESGGTG